jgi:predicted aminopeptidase
MYLKRTIYIIFFSLLLLSLSGCYYINEGCNLINVYSKAEDIDAVLGKQDLAQDERELLVLVKDIKLFAVEELDLKNDENYSTYVQLDKDYLVDVVSACKNDSFEQYNWDYLFMGKMPYRGYFHYEDASKEARKLEQEGYDIYLRQVDAFSTLGFFKDPVFSFMKDYSIYYLANIIIHEQTHATFFINENIDFSENLAVFFGNEGAKQYIKEKHGENSELYKLVILYEDDVKKYRGLLTELYNELKELYSQETSTEEKLTQKYKIIDNWKQDFNNHYKLYFKTDSFRSVVDLEINNAFLATYMNYSRDLDLFYTLYAVCSFDLKKVMQVVKGAKDFKGDAFDYIREYISSVTQAAAVRDDF